LTHEPYGKATSLSTIATHITGGGASSGNRHKLEDYYNLDGLEHSSPARRANATFVILARNSNLDGTVRSVREIEDRFNQYHGYPYVFLNEEPFTEQFKMYVWAIRNRSSA
jgi:alpha 1,2-mannosyltransferase